VVPGAHRISSNTFGAGSIEDVAFQNPMARSSLFALNSGISATTITVSSRDRPSTTLCQRAVATFEWK
jgi:glucosylceramidase